MIRSGWWDSIGGAAGDAWSWFTGIGAEVESLVLSLTTSAWIYLAVWAVAIVDGIFPPVPSESIVIAAATTWRIEHTPVLWGVWLAAAAGAWCGDQIAFSIGRAVKPTRVPFLRGPKGRAILAWAEHALEHRGTAFILAARFIPIGRVAVNLTAGALRFPRRRFMVIDAVGACLWATYGCVLGVFAGSLVNDSLLLAIAIGVVGGILLGYLVDRLLTRLGLEPTQLPSLEEMELSEGKAGGVNKG
ncbi:MAG: DedA family protein [Demequinaceae bacterium]|nr:DedA family protein [Demequinaceae bacterium]